MKKISKSLKSDFTLLLFVIIWGSTFPLGKIALYYIDTIPLLAIRFTMGSLILVFIYFKYYFNEKKKAAKLKASDDISDYTFSPFNKNLILTSALLGFMLFASMALQTEALKYTSAINCGFITSSGVIFIPIFAGIFYKKFPDKTLVIGLLTTLIGIMLVSGVINFSNNTITFSLSALNFGDILTLISAVLFSIQTIFAGKLSTKFDGRAVTMWQITFFTIFAYILWGIAAPNAKVNLFADAKIIIVMSIMGFIASGLAFLAINTAQKNTSPSHVALLLSAEPVFGGIFSRIIPDHNGNVEYLTFMQVIGCIIILGSVICIEYIGARKLEKNNNL